MPECDNLTLENRDGEEIAAKKIDREEERKRSPDMVHGDGELNRAEFKLGFYDAGDPIALCLKDISTILSDKIPGIDFVIM